MTHEKDKTENDAISVAERQPPRAALDWPAGGAWGPKRRRGGFAIVGQ
ncbi:hypothetical protein M8745_02060 [Lutimaribacter sp. EGI FJ00014]|nr:hypothetical protein [Lutimaribacter sp. EGI FJ00014]